MAKKKNSSTPHNAALIEQTLEGCSQLILELTGAVDPARVVPFHAVLT